MKTNRYMAACDVEKAIDDELYINESTKAAIKHFLRSVPSADVVPVVHCKDCKHFGAMNQCFCHAADENGTPIFVRETDYCSYGERREESAR